MRPRTLWIAWYPQVRGSCGLGGGSVRVSGPASTCLWAVRMAQITGTVPVDGQRRLIHWVRQSIAQSQVVARAPRGYLGQCVGRGFLPRLEGAPEDFVRGGRVPYCPRWGDPLGRAWCRSL